MTYLSVIPAWMLLLVSGFIAQTVGDTGACQQNEFQCADGLCVVGYRCDSKIQCADGSDEKDCSCTSEEHKYYRGRISSPTYPQVDSQHRCLYWNIQGQVKDIVTISFSALDLPNMPGFGCGMNYIEIKSSLPSDSQRFCGSLLNGVPQVYISDGNKVYLKFMYDPSRSGKGFELEYIRGPKDPTQKCRSDEALCRNGKCILHKWLCNGVNECEDGSDERNCSAVVHLTTPKPFTCGNHMFGCVSVTTQLYTCFYDYNLCDGFRQCDDGYDESVGCHSQKPCSQNLDGPHGNFTSPNFPYSYPNNKDCSYYISMQRGKTIQLRFGAFDLYSIPDGDYVKVYDGYGESADLLGIFTSQHKPPRTLESTGPQMFIVFHSDSANTAKGFNATYQEKGYCIIGHQFKCNNEEECYEQSHRCDGVWDCPHHGGDERGCSPCSNKLLFPCGTKDSQCFPETDRCNGRGHCSNRHDENDCLPYQCGAHNGTFLCANRQCILETWVCDGANDCGDNTDEAGCPLSTKVIIAAVIGSLTCSLLLVVALGCTCKLYALRLRQHTNSSSRYVSPVTQVQEEIFAQRSAPPPYLEAMRTSRNFDEVQREIMATTALETGSAESRSGVRGQDQEGINHSSEHRSTASSDDDEMDAMIDISAEADLVTEDREGDYDASNVQISLAMGVSAQWRRSRQGRPKTVRSSALSGLLRDQAQEQHNSHTIPSSTNVSNTTEIMSDSASASNESVIISVDNEDDKQIGPSNTSRPTQSSSTHGEHSLSQTTDEALANQNGLQELYDPGDPSDSRDPVDLPRARCDSDSSILDLSPDPPDLQDTNTEYLGPFEEDTALLI